MMNSTIIHMLAYKAKLAVLLVFAVAFMFFAAGCEGKTDEEVSDGAKEFSSQYIGSISNAGDVLRLKKLSDGSFMLILNENGSGNENRLAVLKSEDLGLSWESVAEIDIGGYFNGTNYSVTSADYDDGNYLVCADELDEVYTKTASRIILLDEDLKAIKNVRLDFTEADGAGLLTLVTAELNGDMLCLNYGDKLEIYNLDYNLGKTHLGDSAGVVESEKIVDTAYADDKIYILAYDGISEYDYEGNLLSSYNKNLAEFQSYVDEIKTEFSGLQQRRDVINIDDEGNALFLFHEGIFKYYLETDIVESIINEGDNAFSDGTPEGLINCDGSYFVLSKDGETGDINASGFFYEDITETFEVDLLNQTATVTDANSEYEDKKEITVYSLYYSNYIRKAVDTFNNSQTDIKAVYTAGIDNDSNISLQDAVNSLNTSLYAGDGPDVMFLDGLDIDKYAEEGVLADVSDVLLDYEDLTLDNITKTYYEDGKCYAIPTRFSVSMICGGEGRVSSVTDVDKLKDYINNSDNGINDLFIYTPQSLFNSFYPIYASAMLDGGVNNEAVTEFYNDCYDIYFGCAAHNNSFDELLTADKINQFDSFDGFNLIPGLNNYSAEKIDNWPDITVGELYSIDGILHIYSLIQYMDDNYGEEYTFKAFGSGDGIIYTPKMTVGINSSSNEVDDAKEFLKSALGTDIQKYENTDYIAQSYDSKERTGIAVNDEARNEIYDKYAQMTYTVSSVNEDTGCNKFQIKTALTDAEKASFEEIFEKADICVKSNAKIEEVIISGLSDMIYEGKGADETADEVISRLEMLANE